jgi:hypothetical protein
MRFILILAACLTALGQVAPNTGTGKGTPDAGVPIAPSPAPCTSGTPYGYFGETGISYDYYGHAPASTTGFGIRVGCSNVFLVTDIDTPIGQPGSSYATLREALEYHIAATGRWEFLGFGMVGATTNGTTTTSSFGGGAGISYDLGSLLSKKKFSLPVAFQFRIIAITATQVKPVYGLEFRKTF